MYVHVYIVNLYPYKYVVECICTVSMVVPFVNIVEM